MEKFDSHLLKCAHALALDHPRVLDYIEQKKEHERRKRHRESYALPAAALGLGAAGYGLNRAANWVLSPEDRGILADVANMQARADLFKREHGENALYTSSGQFHDYNDRASLATKVRLMGMPISEAITKLRTGVLGKLTGNALEKADAKFDDGMHNADEHYGSFSAGPLAANWHQIMKLSQGPTDDVIFAQRNLFGAGSEGIAARLRGDKNADAMYQAAHEKLEAELSQRTAKLKEDIQRNPSLRDEINAKTGPELARRMATPAGLERNGWLTPVMIPESSYAHYDDALLRHVRANEYQARLNAPDNSVLAVTKDYDKYWRQYLNERVLPTYLSGEKDLKALDPLDFKNISKIRHEDQVQAARGFNEWMRGRDPKFADTYEMLTRQQAGQQTGTIAAYADKGRPVVTMLHDIPKAVGYGAMGLGGLMGAYWLHNKLGKKNKRAPKAPNLKKLPPIPAEEAAEAGA